MYGWLDWLLSDGLGREKLALLMLCTVAMYIVATHLTWRLVHVGTGRKIVVAVGSSWLGRWSAQVLRLLYYVGIPFAVLWRGDLVSQMGIPTTYTAGRDGREALSLWGMAEVRDVVYLGTGIAMSIGTLCLLIVIWIWYVRALPDVKGKIRAIPWWRALREAFFLQVFWAFCRSFVTTLTAEGMYVAFISFALVAVSWLLNPQRRHDLFTWRGYLVVQDWICALFTALVSLTIHSLWLLFLMHTLWLWVGGRTLQRFSSLPLKVAVAGE
jgi:hypothetical protein